MVNGLCKTGNAVAALQLHREMVHHKKGLSRKEECFKPTRLSYSLVDGSRIEWPMPDSKQQDARISPPMLSPIVTSLSWLLSLIQGDDICDAMLNQTNVGDNNNKFCLMQVLEMDGGGTFFVCNR